CRRDDLLDAGQLRCPKRLVNAHHLVERIVFGEKCPWPEGQHSHFVKDRNSKPACTSPSATAGASSAAPGVSLCRQIDVMPRSARAIAWAAAAAPSVSSA